MRSLHQDLSLPPSLRDQCSVQAGILSHIGWAAAYSFDAWVLRSSNAPWMMCKSWQQSARWLTAHDRMQMTEICASFGRKFRPLPMHAINTSSSSMALWSRRHARKAPHCGTANHLISVQIWLAVFELCDPFTRAQKTCPCCRISSAADNCMAELNAVQRQLERCLLQG